MYSIGILLDYILGSLAANPTFERVRLSVHRETPFLLSQNNLLQLQLHG